MLLEAKGTQTSLTYGISQISDACDQLQAANVIASGYTQTRLAVATALMREGTVDPTTVYVGDPDARKPYEYAIKEDAKQVIQDSHYSRISDLIGDLELSRRFETREPDGGKDRVHRVVLGVETVGTTIRLGSVNRQVEIFVGISSSIRSELLRRKFVQTSGTTLTQHAKVNETHSIAVLHGDGSCLEFTQINVM